MPDSMTTPEQPWPVRVVAQKIGQWVGRLGSVWVEGQVTGLSQRGAGRWAYFDLRDPHADISLRAVCAPDVFGACEPPLADGQQVVALGQPEFYVGRGALQLRVLEVRPRGIGALLAQLEQRRTLLAAEGLFAAERKRGLPFLPNTVGLVTGRDAAALRDVVQNATRRWPAVRFAVREVAVQGPAAAAAVTAALRELDALAEVDVIVVARGGGSVEDLLPFSDEALLRAVAACRTPVVSAIGHEQDVPLLDLVADVRASTPTDAGRLVVPDIADELTRLTRQRRAGWRALGALLERESRRVADDARRIRSHAAGWLDGETAGVRTARARITALSPAATLSRGYAVVQSRTGTVIRDSTEVATGDALAVRLARGELEVTVTDARSA